MFKNTKVADIHDRFDSRGDIMHRSIQRIDMSGAYSRSVSSHDFFYPQWQMSVDSIASIAETWLCRVEQIEKLHALINKDIATSSCIHIFGRGNTGKCN